MQANNDSIEPWKKVVITDDPDDVSTLFKLQEISATSHGERLNTKIDMLEKNATIILQRKAANLNANLVLINDKKVYVAYGDLPFVTLNAIAYRRE